MRRFGMSIRTRSPSRTSANGPPTAASGETWPTQMPRVAPEKRPSVTSATFFAHLLAVDDGGHSEHFPHTGAADRAFIAHDQYLAGMIGARFDRANAVFLAFEYASRSFVNEHCEPGYLDQATIGAEIAPEHDEAAIRRQRCAGFTNNGAVRARCRTVSLGDCVSGHGQAAAVDIPAVEQGTENHRSAADVVHVLGRETPARPQIGDQRGPP